MYAVTGMRALSNEVRSCVSALEIGAWYAISRLAVRDRRLVLSHGRPPPSPEQSSSTSAPGCGLVAA